MNTILKLQTALNRQALSASELKKLSAASSSDKALFIACCRTMPFEFIETPLALYLKRTGLGNLKVSYSDYDPSLPFKDNNEADLFIYWIDWRLYKEKMTPQQVITWLSSRLKQLEGNRTVIINNWPTSWDLTDYPFALNASGRRWFFELNFLLLQLIEKEPKLILCDLDYLAGSFGSSAYDQRNDQVSNYPFSSRFTCELARYFGLTLFPAVLQPKLKLIILDLDNTMYRGVLGEDGFNGIVFEEDHLHLQQLLIKLKNNGILLAICSKNDLADVEHLIDTHPQFTLKRDDFVFIEANWNEKSDNIKSIIRRVNIDASAVLYIDDNIVELSKVHLELPNINLIMADETGKETWHRLRHYPGVYSLEKDETAQKRLVDIVANVKRTQLQSQSDDPYAYLNSLRMQIGIYRNEKKHINRIAELSNKTNQFNTNFCRYSLATVTNYFEKGTRDFYTVTLTDFLSDSGIIGVFSIDPSQEVIAIEEVLISCRALGREVENFALLYLLKQYPEIHNVRFEYKKAERNQPALDWLASLKLDGGTASKDSLIEHLSQRLANVKAEVTYYG